MNVNQFRRKLLDWFDRHQRDLPWRHNRDPYRIWVSEVMLQQTTVAAVVPYFENFLSQFPTVKALAKSDEQQVLHAWQGLGYYRRARNLHAAARQVVTQFGGKIPDDPRAFSELPGVGRYILGAVLSQAFDRRLPIVEANSLRVLCRLYGNKGDPKSSQVQKWLWQTAETLMPRRRVGDFNQAVMELGALVCTPTDPKCKQCPVRNQCLANQQGIQSQVPRNGKRLQPTHVNEVAVVLRQGNLVLIAQRPPNATRWANMWEFPQIELNRGQSHDQAAKIWLHKSLGLSIKVGVELDTVRYSVTRFRMTLTAFEATGNCRGLRLKNYSAAKWVKPVVLTAFPMSTVQRRIVEVVTSTSRQKRLF